jgi:hypothetical protein
MRLTEAWARMGPPIRRRRPSRSIDPMSGKLADAPDPARTDIVPPAPPERPYMDIRVSSIGEIVFIVSNTRAPGVVAYYPEDMATIKERIEACVEHARLIRDAATASTLEETAALESLLADAEKAVNDRIPVTRLTRDLLVDTPFVLEKVVLDESGADAHDQASEAASAAG